MIRKRTYLKYISLKSIFYFCSLPLRLDSYRGCTHGCLYCFSERLNNRRKGFRRNVLSADPGHFSRLMASLNKGQKRGVIRSCLEKKVPVHFGCVSDPMQPAERVRRITQRFLEILHLHQYPFVLCTKSNLIANEPYLSLFKESPCSIQVSFSTFKKSLAKVLEPVAASPLARLRSLEKLAKEGIFTVARLQPFLYPEEKLTSRILRRLADAGVKHVVLEHLRIPTNSSYKSRNLLWKALGKNMIVEYTRLGLRYSRVSYELASEAKINNILFCRDEAHRLGMTFGAGDNDFHHFSDYLCCCGVPNRPEFSNIYTGHIGSGVFMSMRQGKLSFDYLNDEWHPSGGIREHINSHCRVSGCHTVLDFLKHKLKNEGSNSPSSFYGVERKDDGTFIFNKALLPSFLKEAQK